jgi:hypothetical protein
MRRNDSPPLALPLPPPPRVAGVSCTARSPPGDGSKPASSPPRVAVGTGGDCRCAGGWGGGGLSIFLGQNRRYVGESQPKSTADGISIFLDKTGRYTGESQSERPPTHREAMVGAGGDGLGGRDAAGDEQLSRERELAQHRRLLRQHPRQQREAQPVGACGAGR